MRLITCVLLFSLCVLAQQQLPAPATDGTPFDGRVRVLIVDKDSFQAAGVAVNGVAGFQAGVRPINTEQVKSFNKACPAITITSNPERADYIVVWDTKTWAQTSWSGHQNEFAVYDKAGDLVGSGATHKISNAAKDICKIVSNQKK